MLSNASDSLIARSTSCSAASHASAAAMLRDSRRMAVALRYEPIWLSE